MAEILLFHHAHGQTAGFLAFADELRAAGHVVHAPDLYDGKTFAELADGVGYAQQVGFDVIIQRGAAAAEGLPAEIVYAGFSLGVLPAQMLTQTRPGAQGALLLHACVPPAEFETPWPDGSVTTRWRRSTGKPAIGRSRLSNVESAAPSSPV